MVSICFHFGCSLISHLTHCFSRVWCYTYLWIFQFLSCCWFLVSYHFERIPWYNVNVFKFAKIVSLPHTWSILDAVLCALDTHIHSTSVGWCVCCKVHLIWWEVQVQCSLMEFLSGWSIHGWKWSVSFIIDQTFITSEELVFIEILAEAGHWAVCIVLSCLTYEDSIWYVYCVHLQVRKWWLSRIKYFLTYFKGPTSPCPSSCLQVSSFPLCSSPSMKFCFCWPPCPWFPHPPNPPALGGSTGPRGTGSVTLPGWELAPSVNWQVSSGLC